MYIPEINTYFIHIPKCGGTSVEMFFFRNVCGFPNMADNGKMFEQLGREIGAKYHFGQKTPEPLPTGETQHLSAWQLKEWNDPSFCNSNYTFAFVRNPWHRFVSETIWKQQHLGMRTHNLEAQIRMQSMESTYQMKLNRPHNAPQYKFVYDQHFNLLVDDVFKLEEKDKAEKVISEKLNMKVEFGHHNKSKRKDYDDYLTPKIKKDLYPYIHKDLELFGYE